VRILLPLALVMACNTGRAPTATQTAIPTASAPAASASPAPIASTVMPPVARYRVLLTAAHALTLSVSSDAMWIVEKASPPRIFLLTDKGIERRKDLETALGAELESLELVVGRLAAPYAWSLTEKNIIRRIDGKTSKVVLSTKDDVSGLSAEARAVALVHERFGVRVAPLDGGAAFLMPKTTGNTAMLAPELAKMCATYVPRLALATADKVFVATGGCVVNDLAKLLAFEKASAPTATWTIASDDRETVLTAVARGRNRILVAGLHDPIASKPTVVFASVDPATPGPVTPERLPFSATEANQIGEDAAGTPFIHARTAKGPVILRRLGATFEELPLTDAAGAPVKPEFLHASHDRGVYVIGRVGDKTVILHDGDRAPLTLPAD
jgi:hypothetical protein